MCLDTINSSIIFLVKLQGTFWFRGFKNHGRLLLKEPSRSMILKLSYLLVLAYRRANHMAGTRKESVRFDPLSNTP